VNRPRQATLWCALLAAFAAALIAAGCEGDSKPIANNRGAQLFSERCSGCHSLEAAGAHGSLSGQRPTGPNLNKRKLSKQDALYAIRNGGFSGAIMPQNIVVGKDAEEVAEFLARYAGQDAKSPPSPRASGSDSTP
jgi:cytochrome c551